MSVRPVIAILVAVFVAGLAGAAMAATQEYTITVPLTLKGVPFAAPGQKSITVTCAVGPASMAYSTDTGDATGSNGEGKTVVKLSAAGSVVTQNVVVTVTDAQTSPGPGGPANGKAATTYLCWGKYSPTSTATPVNFITGLLH